MKAKYFKPETGKTYRNKNGFLYRCLSADSIDGLMQRCTKDRWTFTAYGCQMYEDGTIEWERSTGGYFER